MNKPDRLDRIEQIKRLAVIAMFYDDSLSQNFALKGGNALDLIYGVSQRASLDLDVSMSGDCESASFLKERLQRSFDIVFADENLIVFDFFVTERPPHVSVELADFWGGYLVEFKLIEQDRLSAFENDIDKLRRNAIGVGKRGSTKFTIDISRHEYCEGKQRETFDDYSIFVYSPEMIVAEKLRAICQQMPEYGHVVLRTRPGGARARDFVDIRAFAEKHHFDFSAEEFHRLIQKVFQIKRVPLDLLGMISSYREFHRPDFESVRDTLRPNQQLDEFDAYFDFVLEVSEQLKTLWNE